MNTSAYNVRTQLEVPLNMINGELDKPRLVIM